MRTRLFPVLATTLGLLTASVALAAPASADHFVDITGSECSAGVFTFSLPHDIRTRNPRDVLIEHHRDGTVVVTCTFRGVPKQRWNDTHMEMWHRPPAGTVERVSYCVLSDHPGRPFPGRGDWTDDDTGTVRFGPAGRATAVCTFRPDPQYFSEA